MSLNWYITSIEQEEATPFVLSHMSATNAKYDEQWAEDFKQHIRWYGLHINQETKGVLGVILCDSMPDDLIVVGLYGYPRAIKMLGDFVLHWPQKNKYGYVDVNNHSWIDALCKRGFQFSNIIEEDAVGNRVHLVTLSGEVK